MYGSDFEFFRSAKRRPRIHVQKRILDHGDWDRDVRVWREVSLMTLMQKSSKNEESTGVNVFQRVLKRPHRGVLALDPGGTTGCAWSYKNAVNVGYSMVPNDQTIKWMEKFLRNAGPSIQVVVIEKHTPRIGVTMGREATMTMELVGGCAAVAERNGCEVVWHTASQMKTVPWCDLGKGIHAKDAAKHLARFLLDDAGANGLIEL